MDLSQLGQTPVDATGYYQGPIEEPVIGYGGGEVTIGPAPQTRERSPFYPHYVKEQWMKEHGITDFFDKIGDAGEKLWDAGWTGTEYASLAQLGPLGVMMAKKLSPSKLRSWLKSYTEPEWLRPGYPIKPPGFVKEGVPRARPVQKQKNKTYPTRQDLIRDSDLWGVTVRTRPIKDIGESPIYNEEWARILENDPVAMEFIENTLYRTRSGRPIPLFHGSAHRLGEEPFIRINPRLGLDRGWMGENMFYMTPSLKEGSDYSAIALNKLGGTGEKFVHKLVTPAENPWFAEYTKTIDDAPNFKSIFSKIILEQRILDNKIKALSGRNLIKRDQLRLNKLVEERAGLENLLDDLYASQKEFIQKEGIDAIILPKPHDVVYRNDEIAVPFPVGRVKLIGSPTMDPTNPFMNRAVIGGLGGGGAAAAMMNNQYTGEEL